MDNDDIFPQLSLEEFKKRVRADSGLEDEIEKVMTSDSDDNGAMESLVKRLAEALGEG